MQALADYLVKNLDKADKVLQNKPGRYLFTAASIPAHFQSLVTNHTFVLLAERLDGTWEVDV